MVPPPLTGGVEGRHVVKRAGLTENLTFPARGRELCRSDQSLNRWQGHQAYAWIRPQALVVKDAVVELPEYGSQQALRPSNVRDRTCTHVQLVGQALVVDLGTLAEYSCGSTAH